MSRPRFRSDPRGILALGTGGRLPADPEPTRARKRGYHDVPSVPPGSKVLGIDLALGTSGYCLVWDTRGELSCLSRGTFTLPGERRRGEGVAELDLRRLNGLQEALRKLLREQPVKPDFVAYEYPAIVGAGWWGGKRQPLTSYFLGVARGLFVAACVGLVGPRRVVPVPMHYAKTIVGGRPGASKQQVRIGLVSRYGWQQSLIDDMTEDESDAASVALSVFGERPLPWEKATIIP